MPLVESCYSNSDANCRRCEHLSECEAASVGRVRNAFHRLPKV